MRKLFFVLLLSCIGILVQAAPIKIALIGNSPETDKATDIALAELSKESEIVLLERKEINKITAEHKLSSWSQGSNEIIRLGKLLNVDIFAVLRSENKEYFFVVFDAKSAVRLIDQQLSGKSPEALAANITVTLKQTIPKLRKENSLRKITLFSIRNVELPRNKDIICNKIAAKLVRQIGQLPDFAVIEGRYIGLINKERELTQVASSLSQASFLLNIDFYQSDIKDHTLIKLEIKVPGQESKHFTMTCNLQTLQISQQNINKIVNYMRQVKQKIKISPKAEAARYYGEFKALSKKRKFSEYLPKIEAALAYDNSNPVYQQALLEAIGRCANAEFPRSRKRCTEEEMNRYLDHLERWYRLEQRFKSAPEYIPSFRRGFVMSFMPLVHTKRIFNYYRRRGKTIPYFSRATSIRMQNGYRIYEEYKNRKYNLNHWMNPEAKLKSKRDMLMFDMDMKRLSASSLIKNKTFSNLSALIKLYLQKTLQAPENISGKNVNNRIISWRLWSNFFFSINNIPENSVNFKKSEKIVSTALKHSWPFIKLYGLFSQYLINRQKEKAADIFLDGMTALFKTLPPGKNSISSCNLYEAARFIGNDVMLRGKIPGSSDIQAKTKDKLLTIMKQRGELYIPILRSFSSRIRSERNYLFTKKALAYLNSRKWKIIGGTNDERAIKSASSKIKHQLTEYLNRHPDLNKQHVNPSLKFDKLVSFKNRAINAAYSDSGQYIYWFSLNYEKSRTYSVKVFCYDTLSKKVKQIGKGVSISKRPQSTHIALSKDYLAISMFKRNCNIVIVCNIKTAEITKLEIPFEWPRSIAIVNKRLLVWCHLDNNLLEYQLPSFKYKVVYSANRRKSPSDPFDNQTVNFNVMFADQKRKRAVIMLSGYNLVRPGWWYYYPEKQKFDYVGIYPRPQGQQWNKIGQDKVLLASKNVSFILDLKNNTKELLFVAIKADKDFKRKKDDFERYAGSKARVIINNPSVSCTAAANTIVENSFWSNHPMFKIDLIPIRFLS